VDLNEATREVIALSRSELQKNQAILSPELADGLPTIAGDRVQLQQVILNLLLNASEAMSDVNDRPRHMVIKTERDDHDQVRLTVKDTGVGFKRESTEKLFEAFHTTKSGGMGIGLSVSRSIIENHHGRIWATPNDGPGATFSFSLPRESQSAAGVARKNG
jgi:signal transduction histidine kinase